MSIKIRPLIMNVEVPTPAVQRVNFISNTYQQQQTSITGGRRTHFMAIPNGADNSQFGDISDGLNTGDGSNVFWVTDYSINSNGDLHIVGFKASNNSTICSDSTRDSWPSLNTTDLYYYRYYDIGGVSLEIQKRGIETPTNAIAALATYTFPYTTTIKYNTVQTDKVYNDISDCTCGFIMDTSVINTITNMQANASYEFNITGTNMIYPLQTNRTIVCGSKNYLESL